MKLNMISTHEAARYMGIKGEIPKHVAELLDCTEELVRERLIPKYIYREAKLCYHDDELYAEGISAPLSGTDIKKHLTGCTKAVFIAATLGSEADKLIRQAEVRDMAEALAVDALCSAAVEQVCDRAEEEIFSQLTAPYRTWRFSPGYGDFPLALQKDILNYLNAMRRIGLTVTDTSLLVPTKSVTAVIGVSDKPVEHKAIKCENCNMNQSCAYRSIGGCNNQA